LENLTFLSRNVRDLPIFTKVHFFALIFLKNFKIKEGKSRFLLNLLI
jgi:hypothetical protein